MIPEKIHQLLHELRIIGGGHEVYESGDDRQMLHNLLAARGVSFSESSDTDWTIVERMLTDEKNRMKKEMDDYYRAFLW
ncbi:MAG: hypothetical protein ACM32O_09735 [Clostridia bacterium]